MRSVKRPAHAARERGDTPELDGAGPLSKNRAMPRTAARFALVTALLAALVTPARADEAPEVVIYKWVDENGIAHYTTDRERIPASLRDRIPEPAPPRDEAWARSDVTPEAPAAEASPSVEAGPELPGAAPTDPALEGQIAALEAEITRDEEALKALIRVAERARAADLAEDPAFRELARRLPKLQADLRALRARRDAASPPSPATP